MVVDLERCGRLLDPAAVHDEPNTNAGPLWSFVEQIYSSLECSDGDQIGKEHSSSDSLLYEFICICKTEFCCHILKILFSNI